MLQEYQHEWEESRKAPQWLSFIWECMLFLCYVLVIVAYVIRATQSPNTYYKTAPNNAMQVMVNAEKVFKQFLAGRKRKFASWRSVDGLTLDFENVNIPKEGE